MLTLVLGGAASGKSEYAERLAVEAGGRKFYLATMQPFDAECEARIQKHQIARQEKGFETLEKYTGIAELQLPKDCTVLLECLSNLAANELFSPDGAGPDADIAILRGIDLLCTQAREVVVVSNEIFSDGISYDPDTERYLTLLGSLNRSISTRADWVVEVVCGIPVICKRRDTE